MKEKSNTCKSGSSSCKCNTKKIPSSCDCNIIHADLVEDVKRNMLDDDTLLCMADFYKAMCDSTRIKIIGALSLQELCVCDMAALLNMTKSAVSHQLQNLKEMNLIKARKKGKEVWYSLTDRHVEEMFNVCHEHVMEASHEENCQN